ncbi:sporulation integral membrane protein YtvI [Brevibacillus daliensis]|uniref:sporulation integral membrane protein YtvI n=1 Tax=Brevibacillus daliensis TaxID=2892995 RepID=UPI001E47994C|nr:sporulation integral membrane protein YtvI [Brevibacillus daliensis]
MIKRKKPSEDDLFKEGTVLTPETWLTRLFQALRLTWVLICIIGIYYAVTKITPLIYPFIFSLIIAIFINRPVNNLSHRLRFPRWISVTVVLSLLLLIVFGLVTLLVNTVIDEIGKFLTKLPDITADVTRYLQSMFSNDYWTNLFDRIQFFYTQLDLNSKIQIDSNLSEALHKAGETFQSAVITLFTGLNTFLLSLPNFGTALVIALLGAFFISKDFYLWETRMRRVLPRGVNTRMNHVIDDLRKALVGFLKAQLTLVSITAAIVIVGLLVLKVEYAVTIGLISGVVDLLPYLGTGTIFVPWIIFMFFKGQYGLAIGLSILYAIVVVFRQIIEPKVVAENVGLDPLLTLVSLFVGLKLFGIFGLIIGPVSLVIINALVKANVLEDIWSYVDKGK